MMFLILTLIILVAAFNVISSLIMMVKDKTRDIAVLRTLGAGRGAIMRIFLMCGASVGVAGTVVGTLIGVLFCRNIEAIQHAVESVTGGQVFDPAVYYADPSAGALDWGDVVQVVAHGAGRCRCWRRCIRAGARRAPIRSRRCGMSEAALRTARRAAHLSQRGRRRCRCCAART